MALERKDVRCKLDPAELEALKVICEADQLDIGEWVERLITVEIHRRIREACVIAERVGRLGMSGNNRDSQGIAGSDRDSRGVPGIGGRR